MNDDVHAELVEELAKTNFTLMSPGVRTELTQFYADPNAPYATKTQAKRMGQAPGRAANDEIGSIHAGAGADFARVWRPAVSASEIKSTGGFPTVRQLPQ